MIIFKRITGQNFLSIGNNPITIELNKHQSTIVSGQNGSGKTAINDLLSFVLYNRAYRNINKPGLINSINGKNCLVTIEFSIGKKQYRIVRGMKPAIFEIYENDVLVNQDPSVKDYQKVLEQQILKMNYRAFTQIVIVGSTAYIPFMKLTPYQRREFIEDLLDIRIFSVMSSQLKEEMKTNREIIKDIETEMKTLKEKFSLQQSFITKQEKELKESTKAVEKEIHEIEQTNDKLQKHVDSLSKKIDKLNAECEKYDSVDEELSQLKHHRKTVKSSIDKAVKERSFYETIDECPQCKQGVAHEHKATIIGSVDNSLKSLEKELEKLDKKIESVTKKYTLWNDLLDKIKELNSELSSHNHEISSNNAVISSKRKQIEKTSKNTVGIDEEKTKLKAFAKEIVECDKKKSNHQDLSHYQLAAHTMLQDTGIKAKVIKQYIPVINKLLNKYLDSLDLFCQFTLDENFNEVVLSRHRDNFVYDNFSEGQKLRINIALLLTWIFITEVKNQASCNLLIADEILDGAMDQSGIDLMLNLFKSLKKKNVFIISHRVDSSSSHFDHSIQFHLNNNFTEVVTS